MYKLPYFSTADKAEILSFMQQQNFAVVTGIGNPFPVATQLPLEMVEENGTLFLKGHLMKKTDHHLAFENNSNVLVLFASPSAYIDANWYTEKPVGSTVNYITVHAKGQIAFTDDDGTYQAIKSITEKHIQPNTDAAFSNIPQTYIDAMVKAIVGFTIHVMELDAVFNLSQNKSAVDRKNIIEKLMDRNEGGDAFIAGEMQKKLVNNIEYIWLKIIMQYNYKILLTKENEGGYMVTVPALVGCYTQGDTIDEALAMAKEAIELYIEELEDRGEPIPDNSNTLEYSLNLQIA